MSRFLKRMMGRAGVLMDEAGGEGGSGGSGGSGATATAGGAADNTGGQGGEQGKQTSVDPGKKAPSDEEARLLKEAMKKKEQIEKLSKELETAKSVASQLDELGGLDAIKALVNQQKEAEVKALEAKGEWERLKERMASEHKASTKSLEDKIAELNAQLSQKDSQVVELSIGTQFSQSQFIAQELTMPPSKARVVYGEHFEVVDGKVVGFDKPRGKEGRTPIVDASGEPMVFEAALKKIVESDPDRDHLLKAKVKQGAGSESRAPASAARQAVAARQEQTKVGVTRIAAGLGKLGKVV